MKICPICRQSFANKALLAQHMTTHSGSGKKGRRQRRPANNTNQTTIAQKEFYGSVTGKADGSVVVKLDMSPTSSSLTKLASMAPMYEQYRINRWSVHFVHAGGANSTGTYHAGVHYIAKRAPSDYKGVAALSPSVCKNINVDASLTVPCGKVMGQPWLPVGGESPGAVYVSVCSEVMLNVFITYSVTFQGPTSISAIDVMYRTDGAKWYNDADKVVDDVTIENSSYGQLELMSPYEQYTAVWAKFKRAFTTVVEIHRMWQGTIGMVHMLLTAGTTRLPVLNVPAILHLTPQPFRATSDMWRQLCDRRASNPEPPAAPETPGTPDSGASPVRTRASRKKGKRGRGKSK